MLLTGDDKQLASIKLGGMFNIFAQEYGAIEMDEIRRQESAVDKKIVASFAKGDALGGLQLLQKKKRLIFASGKEKACDALIDKWASSSFSVKERLILTISNKDALNLNAKVRDILKQQQFMPVITPYLSEQTKAEITALHSSMTQSGRTAKEAMREIAQKYEQINNAWKNNNLPVADKNFGVTDFQGKKHTNEYSYFLAIYQDPKISHLIDYQSDLGKQIQQTTEYQLSRERSLSL